jgi:hypothetical protein
MRKCLRNAEHTAPDVSIAMINADRPVADKNLAGADLNFLETKALEAAVLPEDDCFHYLQ